MPASGQKRRLAYLVAPSFLTLTGELNLSDVAIRLFKIEELRYLSCRDPNLKRRKYVIHQNQKLRAPRPNIATKRRNSLLGRMRAHIARRGSKTLEPAKRRQPKSASHVEA